MPRSLAETYADLPPQLDAILGKMMAKDRAHRYQTPAEVAAALASFTKTERPGVPRHRRLWWAAGCWWCVSSAAWDCICSPARDRNRTALLPATTLC